MWPFNSKEKRVKEVALILDGAFSDALHRIKSSDVDAFNEWLKINRHFKLVNGGPTASNCITWQDHRLPSFIFWIDLNAEPWSLHAICNNGHSVPSFIGISINGGQSHGGKISKAVSVDDYMRVKATTAAKQLSKVLSDQYGYRDLTRFLSAFK